MPTTDELQSQINALQSQLNSILGMADDDYIHQYSGEEIDAGITAAGGAVRYDLAQSLTTTQQAQARGNINAAPGGYGLGGNAKNLTADDNIDDCKTTGWYMWDWNPANQPAGLPDAAKYHVGLMRVEAATVGSGDACQTIYFPKSTGTVNTGDQCTIQRMGVISGAWNPFEWINPPLALGVEYRTTERYLGKPVYVKLINVGTLPNNATKSVSIGDGVQYLISAYGNDLQTGQIIPGTSIGGNVGRNIGLSGNKNAIIITTNYDASVMTQVYIFAKYTKSTD